MPTAAEARDYPRGRLALAFCDRCGFVFNPLFDPSVHEYSPRYEETQAFSPTFLKFAREVATDYVERYHPETVLEIGCGKGEFLLLTCEVGNCKGIGIDPGTRPERATGEVADRVEWIVDFYSEKYSHLTADLVLCRHTLEHIGPVAEFVGTVRRAVGNDPRTAVCFELPDVERVLEDRGFWDVYYEHCSYFSLGSLSRLFRAQGFRVTRLEKCYGDQYLLLDSHPGEQTDAERLPEENDLERIRDLVARYERDVPAAIDRWRAYFADAKAKGETVAIWGSGSKAVALLTTLGVTDEVRCVTDVNPYRHGMFMPGSGHEIVPPEELKKIKPDRVVAMNPIYLTEIGADLQKMGLKPDLCAV